MNSASSIDFRWLSPLGISVILFLIISAVYLLCGFLTSIGFRLYGSQLTNQFGLIFSARSDAASFGRTPHEIILDNPSILAAKVSIMDMIFGLYAAVGILHACLVWFGLRNGQAWSLWALAASDFVIIFFFLLAAKNFSATLAPLRFSDLAPYALVPGAILPFATVLGWVGLR